MSLYNFSWVLLQVLGKQYFEIISTYVLCANEILYIGGCEWPKDAKHVTELVELGCTLIVTLAEDRLPHVSVQSLQQIR